MHPKENDVLEHIKVNPFISQSELAKKLGLTSSSVSSIISDLIKRIYSRSSLCLKYRISYCLYWCS